MKKNLYIVGNCHLFKGVFANSVKEKDPSINIVPLSDFEKLYKKENGVAFISSNESQHLNSHKKFIQASSIQFIALHSPNNGYHKLLNEPNFQEIQTTKGLSSKLVNYFNSSEF